MEAKHLAVLQSCPLFASISAREMIEMLSCLDAHVKRFEKNETVLRAGDAVDSIGVVLEGIVEVSREDAAGRRMILTMLDAGSLFAESFVCAGVPVSPVSVRAASDCAVLLLAFDRVMNSCSHSCSHHRLLVRNMLLVTAKKNLLLNRKIEFLMMKGMREKIAAFLLEHVKKGASSATFRIPMSRNELAEFLNVDRSALSRELSRLRGEGLIDYYKESFSVSDVARLSALLPQ